MPASRWDADRRRTRPSPEIVREWRSVSSASPRVWPRGHAMPSSALFAVVLLASSPARGRAGLTPLGSQISCGRRSQAYYESVMLAQRRPSPASRRSAKSRRLSSSQPATGAAARAPAPAPRGGRARTSPSSRRGTRTRRPRTSRGLPRTPAHDAPRGRHRPSGRPRAVSCAPPSALAARGGLASGC